tara:strand:- start:82 stop:516 length:435 start_codon:yes stop_codon:yes gene_type:complete
MSRHRKDRGLRTERVVAEYLAQWWHGSAVGRGAGKDIVNFPMDIEIKARADFSPLEYLKQSKKRTEKTGEDSLVICRMNGQGESPENYLAFMPLGQMVQILLKAGYADFQTDSVQLEPEYCHCGNTIMKGSPCHICEKLNNANL